MVEIHIGTKNPLKKRAKNIYEAVTMSIPGDTLIFHKDIELVARQSVVIPHTLYFTAPKSIKVFIPRGTLGFYIQGRASVEFLNINMFVAGQANAVVLENYQGNLRFLNGFIRYQKDLSLRDRNPLVMTDSSYTGSFECTNSQIDHLEVAFDHIKVKESRLGLLAAKGGSVGYGRLYAQSLKLQTCEVTHLELASGQVEKYCKLSSYGDLRINGAVSIEGLEFSAISMSSKEEKHLARLLKKYSESAENITQIFALPLIQSDQNIHISHLNTPETVEKGSVIKQAFLNYQNEGNLRISHGKINSYPYLSLIDGQGTIVFEDVVDDSQYTIFQKPHVSGERSMSPLLEMVEQEKEEARENSQAFEELQAMIGLAEPKAIIERITATERMKGIRIARGMATPQRGNRNLLFAGPPGTGKTTVADKMAQILYDVGAIQRNIVHETTPGKLKGTVIGESGKNIIEACEKARGGVLFIDEAYSLTTDDQYNKDIIDELLTWTDEKHCEELIVILAGYKEELEELIYKTNPGLARRFPTWVNFSDYSSEELKMIALYVIEQRNAIISPNALETFYRVLDEKISSAKTLPHFGNASFINTFVNKLIEARDVRLSSFNSLENLSNEHLVTITLEDIQEIGEKV